MSLLRLLTTGKSLVGVSDVESRYRVTRERLLPQFGSARNPFTSRGKAEPAPAEAPPSANCGGNGGSEGGGGIEGASAEPAAARAGGALRLKAAALLSRWKGKIGGLLPRPRSKVVKPAITRFTKPPVQGELSLDKINVVRNDLSDADLEVVRAKVAAKAPATRTTEEDLGAETALGRVTARILGVRKP
jgi:hypothetical protein